MAAKAELLRLAAPASASHVPRRVSIDPSSTLPGRGAYLCRDGERPRRECLEQALARKAFARAFRRPVEVPVELVESVGP